MFKSVFLLLLIFSSVAFTPLVFGQELKKATWLENASVIYDQKYSKTVIASVAFETINNNEIAIPDSLLQKIVSKQEIRNVVFSNMGECVMGVPDDKQCIMINFDLQRLKGEGGITTVQNNGKMIGDQFISELNQLFGTDAKFHSIFIHGDSEGTMSGTSEFTSARMVSAAYTMPKQETSVVFDNLSENLIAPQIASAGGFFDVAREMVSNPESIASLVIVQDAKTPLLLLKVSHEYSGQSDDISMINPLDFLGVNELERSKHFENIFVPLNSVVQVVIFPESPSQINSVKTNVLTELASVEDVSNAGWFFTSTSPNAIDARFLFGTTNTISADELTMKLGPWDMQNTSDSFSAGDINVETGDSEGQYAILVGIIVAAIAAAAFYMKGYKKKH